MSELRENPYTRTMKLSTLATRSANGPADQQVFASQFRWRRNTGTQHVPKAMSDNCHA